MQRTEAIRKLRTVCLKEKCIESYAWNAYKSCLEII